MCSHRVLVEGSGLGGDGLTCEKCGYSKYPEALSWLTSLRIWLGWTVVRKLKPGERFYSNGVYKPVKACYCFQNGMLMVFGWDDQQIPELQGRRSEDLLKAIRARSDERTHFEGLSRAGVDWNEYKTRGSNA